MSGSMTAERLESTGNLFSYDFTDKRDERDFRKKFKRRTWILRTAYFLFAVVLYGAFVVYVATTVDTFAAAILSILFVVAIYTMSSMGRFSSLQVELQRSQIALTYRTEVAAGISRPYTERIKAEQVSSLQWLHDGCLIEMGPWYLPSRFIDERILLQPGVLESISEWAKQNKIDQVGTPPRG